MNKNFTLFLTELWQTPLFVWALVFLFLSLSFFAFIRLYVWFKSQKDFMYGNAVMRKPQETQKWGKPFKQGLCVLVVSLISGFVFGFLGAVFIFFLCLGVVIGLQYKSKRDQRQRIKQQLPLFIRALGSTLKAGYSVPQALEFVAFEAIDPLKEKLKSGQRLLQMQQPLGTVLSEWRQKIAIPEFSFLADSLKLQSQSGGNLVALCHAVALRLDERRQLEQDIRSFTAQGKMSGYLMALLWPISLVLFAWLSPSHTEILFHTSAGRMLLGLSFSLELLGFYFIARLVRLKI